MIVSLNVTGWRCLVVGGGRVALRKAETLLNGGAAVTLVSPRIPESSLAFERLERPYRSGDCTGFRLVFACTDSREVNALVAREARGLGALCNIADAPAESDFANVATMRQGDIEIGISTGGASAALAKHLRERVEQVVGPEYGALAEILGARRGGFTSKGTREGTSDERGAAWRAVLESDVLARLRAGDRAGAEQRVDEILRGAS